MGTIALLRQTYYDSQWYTNTPHDEYTMSLEAFGTLQELHQFFEVGDVLDMLRADKIAKEFVMEYLIKTGGVEYQRLADVKATVASLLVTPMFLQFSDLATPAEARSVTLARTSIG